MDKFKAAVVDALIAQLNLHREKIASMISVPPDSSMGDFAFPCFALAKELRKSPVDIAVDLSKKIGKSVLIHEIVANGPYVNFFVSKPAFTEAVLTSISKEQEKYGSLKLKEKKAIIEHTSINPNASPHVGRARNSLIGDSLARLLRFHGYDTDVHYFVNDIGKQIALLVIACRGKKPKFNDLLNEYIRINAELETNKELENEAFTLLKKLEEGDKETIADFRKVVDCCVKGQKAILSELGIEFNHFDYESGYLFSKKTEDALQSLELSGRVFVDDEGRKVLDLSGFDLAMKSPVLVLKRADGTSLYPLRDIAYTIDKISKAKDRNIVVLGEDHKLYFSQICAVLSLIKLAPPEVIHYSFVLLASGKMSTRSGNVVLLEEFMQQAYEKAEKELISRKNTPTAKIKKLARSIGYGALKYHIIKVSPEKNVFFDWDQALSFEGESAPYIQYAHARICSILKKAGSSGKGLDFSLIGSREEFELIRALAGFPDIAEKALSSLRPHLIANYLQLVADNFNRFYHACPVISEDKHLMATRLALVSSTGQVLKTGLGLLGIDAPEKM